MPEVSPSVLVIRLDAIGDALALVPALASLRQRSIPFDVVLSAANAGVFAQSVARRTFLADFALRSSTPANLSAIERFGAELSRNDYTHVVVATEDPGGYRLAAAIGAKKRIGFADPWTKPLKALWTRRLLTDRIYRSARLRGAEHECETLFRLVAPLTGDTAPSRDAGDLRPLVLDGDLPPDPRVALQLTDKWERLGLTSGDVERLVRDLNESGPLRVLASPSEAAYVAAIAQCAGVRAEYFDELRDWKAAVAAAHVLVAPDSGAIHLAGMIGTPVVAIFAPQRNLDAQVARWSPWAAPSRIVRATGDWPLEAARAAGELRNGH